MGRGEALERGVISRIYSSICPFPLDLVILVFLISDRNRITFFVSFAYCTILIILISFLIRGKLLGWKVTLS